MRAGGANNHRDNLGSAVLIKDNHIAACGSVRRPSGARGRALRTRRRSSARSTTLEQLDEALAARADIVLLDNMDTPTVAEAVRARAGRHSPRPRGGSRSRESPALARLGVDVISVGALTHSVKAADIGLDFA